ncbi:hypothetical protein [Pseudomonas marincola]|uniref:hypothetical protein n=1 Tax=Pseudomonas marincola TaxID=437900 RepID=UPI001FCD0C07|nr:hypothetical protein [Pseudomonas marincola]
MAKNYALAWAAEKRGGELGFALNSQVLMSSSSMRVPCIPVTLVLGVPVAS